MIAFKLEQFWWLGLHMELSVIRLAQISGRI